MILRITTTTTACAMLLFASSLCFLQRIKAFSPLLPVSSSSCQRSSSLDTTTTTRLYAGAGGGGMAATTTKAASVKNNKQDKNNGKEKAKKNGMCKKISNSSNGNGKKHASSFDVNASLLRLEKRYEQLQLAAAKQLAQRQDDDDDDDKESDEDPRWASDIEDNNNKAEENIKSIITSEFIVAARASTRLGVDDWVPVAQLLVSRCSDGNDESSLSSTTTSKSYSSSSASMSSLDLASIAVSAYCRELSHLAAFGAPAFFKSVARNGLEYSLESIDSFHKHVYTGVVDGGHAKVMTKAEARKVLGLEEQQNINNNNINNNANGSSDDNNSVAAANPKSAIKQAYRRLSFDLHPDRFQGTVEEHEEAAQRFAQVKQAYESLSSGVRGGGSGSLSWYESLGGKARTDFVGPVNLLAWPLSTAENDLKLRGCEAAIAGLDKDLIQSFVARNLRSSE